MRPTPKEVVDQICQLFHSGKTVWDIGAALSLPTSTVRRVLNRNGLHYPKVATSKETVDAACELFKTGKTLLEICKALSLPYATARKVLAVRGFRYSRKKSKQALCHQEICDMAANGVFLHQIADALGLSRTELWTYCKVQHIEFKKALLDPTPQQMQMIKDAVVQNLELPVKQRLTLPKLAAELGVTTSAVKAARKQLGVVHDRSADMIKNTPQDFLDTCRVRGFTAKSVPDKILMTDKITLICPCGAEFAPMVQSVFRGTVTSCGCLKSKAQADLLRSIQEMGFGVEKNNKRLLDNRELDVYIPSKKFAIEYNGLYWHREDILARNRDNPTNYHADKFHRLAIMGIQLITIFEDEWLENKELVLSMLRAKLGVASKSIFARKCNVTWDKGRVHDFVQRNHIQGACHGAHLGLELDGEVVAGMIFRANGRLTQSGQELARFCNLANTRVVGGFSKLLRAFIEKHSPTEVVSLSDNRWSDGGLYKNNGFSLARESEPSYYYVKGSKRLHKSQFRLERLKKMGWYEEGKTEAQITAEHGLHRIYDCGKKAWLFRPQIQP